MTQAQVHVIRRGSSLPITGAFCHCFSKQKGLSQEIGVHPRTWWSGFCILYTPITLTWLPEEFFLECGRLRALSNFSFESQKIESAREGGAAKTRGTRAVALFLFTSSLFHLTKILHNFTFIARRAFFGGKKDDRSWCTRVCGEILWCRLQADRSSVETGNYPWKVLATRLPSPIACAAGVERGRGFLPLPLLLAFLRLPRGLHYACSPYSYLILVFSFTSGWAAIQFQVIRHEGQIRPGEQYNTKHAKLCVLSEIILLKRIRWTRVSKMTNSIAGKYLRPGNAFYSWQKCI